MAAPVGCSAWFGERCPERQDTRINKTANSLNATTLTTQMDDCVTIRAHRPQIGDRIHTVLPADLMKGL